jgi:hypothetical protein
MSQVVNAEVIAAERAPRRRNLDERIIRARLFAVTTNTRRTTPVPTRRLGVTLAAAQTDDLYGMGGTR